MDAYETSYAAPARRVERRRRPITPLGVLVALAIAGSIGLVLYGLFIERGGVQIPLLVSGLAIFGITCAALSMSRLAKIVRVGSQGETGAALRAALLGGIAALAAAGSLAAAVILALLWSSA